MLAAARDVVTVAPIAFLVGLALGFWIGGRFTITKHNDR